MQQVHTQTGAVATGTTQIPLDDTVPQITEGTEFMTLAITPASASNILLIDAIVNVVSSAQAWVIVALFQDSTANALASSLYFVTAVTAGAAIPLQFRMVAGTTSSTTFRIRVGPHTTSTLTFNGQASARKLGGVFASSLTITELSP